MKTSVILSLLVASLQIGASQEPDKQFLLKDERGVVEKVCHEVKLLGLDVFTYTPYGTPVQRATWWTFSRGGGYVPMQYSSSGGLFTMQDSWDKTLKVYRVKGVGFVPHRDRKREVSSHERRALQALTLTDVTEVGFFADGSIGLSLPSEEGGGTYRLSTWKKIAHMLGVEMLSEKVDTSRLRVLAHILSRS